MPLATPWVGVATTLATLTLLAVPARASMPQAQYAGLQPPQPTSLVLGEESVDITCPPNDLALRCTVQAHYVVTNPGEARVELDVPIVAAGINDISATVDGTASNPQARVLMIHLDPGARSSIDIVFQLVFEGASASPKGWSEPQTAVQARHPLLGGVSGPGPAHPVIFRWSRNWAQVLSRHFDVRYPSGWKLHGSKWKAQGAITEQFISRDIAPGDEPVDVDLRKKEPRLPVANGGPVVAVGGALGDGFRMRYGYEAGVLDWILPAVHADVNYAGLAVLTPSVDVATSAQLPLPSLAVGLGMPVRIRPESRAGVRLKLSAAMAVGVEATVDYYPADNDWESTLAARLSL